MAKGSDSIGALLVSCASREKTAPASCDQRNAVFPASFGRKVCVGAGKPSRKGPLVPCLSSRERRHGEGKAYEATGTARRTTGRETPTRSRLPSHGRRPPSWGHASRNGPRREGTRPRRPLHTKMTAGRVLPAVTDTVWGAMVPSRATSVESSRSRSRSPPRPDRRRRSRPRHQPCD